MEPGSQDAQSNFFERNPVKTLLAIVLLAALAIEGVSFLLLVVKGKTGPETYWYNRTLSGYRVFKSTPDFTFRTIRDTPDDPLAVIDEHGFLSDGPVALAKPEGTIRIFLMGGSGLFGAGQSHEYSTIHEYPGGGMIYSYSLSISGQLKKDLERRYPGVHFEVITAAAFLQTLHQSFLYYVETISRFSPDYVINMDGYNDVPSMFTGAPYPYLEKETRNYAILRDQFESNRWLKNHVSAFRVLSMLRRKFFLTPEVGFGADERKLSDLTISSDLLGAYQERRRGYIQNSKRFMQILNHYMATLRSDGVQFIFSLQPMLDRSEGNKPLSTIESKMASEFGLWHGAPKNKEDGALILKYFFDDYLSDELARQTTAMGVRYVDIGDRMKTIPANVEFYTDYCHMTQEGNRLIAIQFSEALIAEGLTAKLSNLSMAALPRGNTL
jgi:hypothetical protein